MKYMKMRDTDFLSDADFIVKPEYKKDVIQILKNLDFKWERLTGKIIT